MTTIFHFNGNFRHIWKLKQHLAIIQCLLSILTHGHTQYLLKQFWVQHDFILHSCISQDLFILFLYVPIIPARRTQRQDPRGLLTNQHSQVWQAPGSVRDFVSKGMVENYKERNPALPRGEYTCIYMHTYTCTHTHLHIEKSSAHNSASKSMKNMMGVTPTKHFLRIQTLKSRGFFCLFLTFYLLLL